MNTNKNFSSHAQRRLEEKKDALRAFIKGQNYIQAINADLERENITPEQLPVIKFKTETRLALLKKVIPDLKQIDADITGNLDVGIAALGVLNGKS